MNDDIKIFAEGVEEAALNQINTLVATGIFSNSKMRIMPDVHQGEGCVIGFTANLKDKVIPNIVGVDIGCGVLVVKIGNVNIDYQALDNYIKNNIPSGFSVNKSFVGKEEKEFKEKVHELIYQQTHCFPCLDNPNRLVYSCGTLGGGNHFIEICIDDHNNKYLVVHTGSRNLGYQVALYYQSLAISKCQNKRDKEGKQIPKDLCYLIDDDMELYINDMKKCQTFAVYNRLLIINRITRFLGLDLEELPMFESIHNYIGFDNIIRKGAISAYLDEELIIPINMKDGCIIGIGKGNADWNYSAPHGAGRILSRRQAKKVLDLNAFKKEMAGIYTSSISYNTLDEAPMAYKPINEIIKRIKDTVEIKSLIKPVYNFKAPQ